MSELTNQNVVIVEFDVNTQPNKIATDKLNEACLKAETLGRDGVLVIKWCQSRDAGASQSLDDNNELAVYQVSRWEKALRRVEKLDVLTIAQIEADVTGFGLSLILLTDYRISRGQLTVNLRDGREVLPGMVVHRLTHQIGGAHARKLVLFGKSMAVESLYQLGLVDDISQQTDAATSEFIASLDEDILRDVAVRRRLLLECLHQSYDEALGTHLAASDRMLRAQ